MPDRAVLVKEFSWRDDPVLRFILDDETWRVVIPRLEESSMSPEHNVVLSHRRVQLAGFEALKKRCQELDWPELTATVALAWQRESREEANA